MSLEPDQFALKPCTLSQGRCAWSCQCATVAVACLADAARAALSQDVDRSEGADVIRADKGIPRMT